jgi:hypothetical protein
MKKYLITLLFAYCAITGIHAHAANCPLASGGSISSAVSSCGSGNTVQLAAGTYTISSQFTLPCGVSISGPVVPYSQTPNQTAHITGSVGNNSAIKTTAGCSVPQTIEYVEWNGGRPNPGGSFLYVVPGSNHVYVYNSNIHGNNCGAYCGSTGANLILVYGANPSQTGCCNASGAVTNDIIIMWNIFSAAGDCGSGAIVESQNSDTEGGGGYCNGVGLGGNLTNIIIENNKFMTGDNEIKYYEAATNSQNQSGSSGYGNPITINYNSFQQYDRIAYEGQINWGGPNEPTLEYIQYNSFSNMLNPHQQDFDISAANGCLFNYNTPNMTQCVNHVDYNLTVTGASNTSVGCGNVGYEYWGGIGSTANGNVWSGAYNCHTIDYAPSGQFTANNNTAFIGGSTTSCGLNNMVTEDNPNYGPSCSGNYSTSATTGTITSVAPVLSVSGSVVTIRNTNVSTPNGSNPGRDSNTTFWCTGDGSTPVAGGASSTPYWVGAASQTVGTFTPSSGTAKCLGMWGAPNQPFSYTSGYGYVPSAVISAVTGPSITTPTFSPVSTSFITSQVVTLNDSDSGSTIYYTTDGSTPTTSSTVYSSPITVTSTTVIQAIGHTTAGTSAVVSATYTQTPVTTPTFTPASESFSSGTVSVTISDSTSGATIYYTTNGSTPTTSSTVYSSAITVSATTTINAIAVKSGYAQSAVGTGVYTLGASLTVVSGHEAQVSNINTLAVNAPAVPFTAVATYSNSTTGTLPDSYGNTAVWTSSNTAILNVSPGSVYCVATGTANIQVTAQPSGVVFSVWTMTCTAAVAAPTLSGGYLGNTGSINTSTVGAAAIQFTAYGTYSDSQTRPLPDQYGNTAVWTSSNSAILNVSSTGLVSCVGDGSANVQVTTAPGGVHFSVWGVTCSGTPAPTLQSITIAALQTNFIIGQNNGFSAQCGYSDGSSDDCTNPDVHGSDAVFTSSSTSVGTITTAGVFTAKGAGTTSVTATVGGITSNALSIVGAAASLFGHTIGYATAWVR